MSTNFAHLCRICMMVNDNLVCLTTTDEDFVELHVKLYFCVPSIKIDDVNYPQQVCESCIVELRSMYNFKQKCLRSMKIFTDIIKNEGSAETVVKTEDAGEIEEPIFEIETGYNEEVTADSDKEDDECESERVESETVESERVFEETDETVEDMLTEQVEQAIVEQYDDDHCYFSRKYIEENITKDLEMVQIKQETTDMEDEGEAEGDAESENELRESVLHPIFPTLSECQSTDTRDIMLPRFDTIKKKFNSDDYFCTICNVGFNKSEYIHHKRKHKNINKITCPLCSREFMCPRELRQFFRHYCPNTNGPRFLLTCTVCYRKFKSSQALANHKKTHSNVVERFQCRICDLYFNSVQKLDWHVRNGVHTDKVTKKLKHF